ncbi:MAG: tRNA 2-thiocytidine biosynthesis TtcA family protein [Clostridia bacterium]|nr:tRNA 2-thiocytidine biosynthesis TtcA family protein [Clostridia bacterium]MCI2000831.1 tRNA 2-thiocytidine biosynthesis TtcA family protein [Clostridia bacterium]MCI2015377.1 tRNA 2-thiocytidine biosynthesis TtcA family protein [Clostridia bacterium]
MKHQRLLSYVRRAVDDYKMINEGDKIAIGLSGGKDSMCLLYALADLRRFYPNHFEIEAITVSLGFDGTDFSKITKICENLNVRHSVLNTDIGQIIFEERKESNPCSLCAKMRKGALNDKAQELGCNKVALGHNRDDIIETFIMSLIFEARINTFAPVSFLDRKRLYSIRPLMYVPEKETKSYVYKNNVPIVKNPCPANGNTKRQEIKELIHDLSKKYDNLDGKIFSAIQRSNIKGWIKER